MVGIDKPTIKPLLIPNAAITMIITSITAVITVFSDDSILFSISVDSSSTITALIRG